MASYTRPGMVGGATGGTFEQRMRELSNLVGTGKITVKVGFDQAYARRQHQGALYEHPRGGKPFFLRDALLSSYKEHYQRVAMELFRGNTQVRFIQFGEAVAHKASVDTPIELGNLRRSGSVKVLATGRTIYTRPAGQRRLTRRELNDRIRLRHFDMLKGRFNR